MQGPLTACSRLRGPPRLAMLTLCQLITSWVSRLYGGGPDRAEGVAGAVVKPINAVKQIGRPHLWPVTDKSDPRDGHEVLHVGWSSA